jgi:hypothetical protein
MTDRAVVEFATIARLLYVTDSRSGQKLLRAVTSYVCTGECNSNAEEDSVCGGVCAVCTTIDEGRKKL